MSEEVKKTRVRKQLNVDALKKKFAQMFASEKEVTEAKKMVAEAEERKSEILKEIREEFGRGPYKIGDASYVVAQERETARYYWRASKPRAITLIE